LPPDFVIPKDQGATIDEPLLGLQRGVRMDKEKGKSTNLATNKDEGKKKKCGNCDLGRFLFTFCALFCDLRNVTFCA
jgi:hypothetical protein